MKEDCLSLQAKVLQFLGKLMDKQSPHIHTQDLIEQYKQHFNIETKRHGEIKN